MFVAEAFLSSFFEVLLDKLVATPLLEYARRQKVDKTLQQWRRTLLQIQAVLLDAEQKQIRDRAVKLWLDDLKALAYDIEDVLDEFNTEANQHNFEKGPQTRTSKVQKLIRTFHPSAVMFNEKFGKKIKQITQELDAIVKTKSDLHLREGVGGVSSVIEQRLTTSLVDEFEVYGRDGDKEKIMELLLSDEVASADKVQVIPIVGIGGVGKTTLAQIIYNDKRVEDNFNIRVWVCVSDQFDLVGITKAILESLAKHSSDSKNLQLLQDSLKKELSGKKFFLVLDDIWNENPNSWSILQAPFKAGAQGSVIIVTTRQEHVASIMRTTSSYHLGELSDEHCWSLFAHVAFQNTTTDAFQNLEPIGRKIIKKCKGLPLAAKTIGGLLRSKQDENTWKDMLNNEIWDLPAEQSSILPALHLSYHYLPTKLKQCFAYCSIFPKDYEFEKKELILLWSAEGLVGGWKRGEIIEEVGENCFQNLLLRSFFQPSGHNKSLFVMHDLIHDLAQFVSGEFCLRLEVGKQNHVSNKARHLSYIREEFDVSRKFDPLCETDNLRTFLPLSMPLEGLALIMHPKGLICYLADKVLHNLLPTLRCLRVLSLSHYNITHLPDSFGNLKHLRYLNLSYTAIKKLPPSIGMLWNLQWLMLSNCLRLTELPPEIGKLINLRHLDISETILEGMPTGINRLKDLRRLTTFVVGKHGGARIAELQNLSQLQGALSILKLQNVVYAMDALEANLQNKKDLDDLVFAWEPNGAVGDSENQTRVLEKLQPHNKVKRLSVEYYYSAEFPNWLGDTSFVNLVFLQLKSCWLCSSLPPLGQLQSLKDLVIVKMDGVRKVGAEFYGNGSGSASFKPFRSLVVLRFEEMLEWEEWDCSGVEFPCLKELYMKECPKLKGDIPKQLPLLTNLEITECGQLVASLPMLPSIHELRLKKCDGVVSGSSVRLTSLTVLDVNNICKIPVELQYLHSLERLELCDCPDLNELPPVLHKLTSLKYLEIKGCPRISSVSEMELPSMLERLRVEHCDSLESLPERLMHNSTRLRYLYIMHCGSLRSLPSCIGSLESLFIRGCRKVELPLPQDMMHNYYPSLTRLSVTDSCESLTSFPLGFFTKLGYLSIMSCSNLESLSIPEELHRVDLTSLKTINISHCPNLVSFPQGGLPTPNLETLLILNCEKLKSLPPQMRTLLTSLEYLSIVICPEIESFPEGGLPTSLSQLDITSCSKLTQGRMSWGLQTLPFLREIKIGVDEEERLESFPEKWLLPPTLTTLTIWGPENLKSLDNKGLQHLTSLETLVIRSCYKLKHFPKQGLPSSLCCLKIGNCPLLKKRCQRDKGKEWSKISHISCIVFEELDEEGLFRPLHVIL